MANPLYNRLFGSVTPQAGNTPAPIPEAGGNAGNAPQMTMQDALGQLQANPAEMIRKGGYNVPDQIAGDPRQTVMHLIQSGQVGSPMMRMIMPMLRRMGVR